MKKTILLITFMLFSIHGVSQSTIDSLPFSISIEEIDSSIADLPGIHSFAYAKSGSRWLIVTGRIEGLHGFSTNNSFESVYANSNLLVIDTSNWQLYTFPVDSLDSIYHSILRSTNTQFYQDGNNLFILGGYTWEASVGFYTSPYIISIDVDEMIDAVITHTTNSAIQHIRSSNDTIAAVTGGKLMKLGNDYYLVMGNRFDGFYNQQFVIYTQYYTEAIRKFNIIDNGTTVSISNFTSITDTNNFHRRDLNVEYYKATNGQTGIAAFGGVFRKNQDWPFLNPIYFDGANYSIDTFNQKMSQYTCPVVSLFDSTEKEMYQIFFGGISLYNYLDSSGIQIQDSLVPFINDITVQIKKQDGSSFESILDLKMPELLGSNMVFIPSERGAQFDHGIYNSRKDSGRTMIGYLYGGIKATLPNTGLSSANNKIYRLYLETYYPVDTTSDTTGVFGYLTENNFSIFPNPVNDFLNFSGLQKNHNYDIEITDVFGRSILTKSNFQATSLSASIGISQLYSGFYFIKIKSENDSIVLKFIKK